jgi:hypothetical protein
MPLCLAPLAATPDDAAVRALVPMSGPGIAALQADARVAQQRGKLIS